MTRMLCKSPIGMAGQVFGCGQCLPCRINRSRVWSHRIMLEAMQYTDNCFMTLTYDDEHLPEGSNLVPADLTGFLKRLRFHYYPRKIRYYGVGEYGSDTQRPHYHLAVFNFPNCLHGLSKYSQGPRCCSVCDTVTNIWGNGNILCGTLEPRSAAYVCGYIVKKMTRLDDPRLKGRVPEFARMSRMPGIGYSAMHEVADVVLRNKVVERIGDVPTGLRHGSSIRPIGRYLSNSLRALVGEAPGVPQKVLDEISAEMFDVRLAARSSEENPSVTKGLIARDAGKVASAEARYKLFSKKRENL